MKGDEGWSSPENTTNGKVIYINIWLKPPPVVTMFVLAWSYSRPPKTLYLMLYVAVEVEASAAVFSLSTYSY